MKFLPVFLDVKERPCLVVGAGTIAERKVRLLLEAGARVTVIAPDACDALAQLNTERRIEHHALCFAPEQLAGYDLVIAATADKHVNEQVSESARARNMPVNVVDQSELCGFIVPSILDRSPVIVAVSTGGAAPVLARLLRARLESLIPAGYGRLASLMREFRQKVAARLPGSRQRRRFWEDIVDGPVAELVLAGRDSAAREALVRALDDDTRPSAGAGEVYLVGAGPGDPDLLTFRALRLLQRADVVLYDRLVNPRILAMARRDAERIYVGKQKAHHSVRQNEINAMMIRLARQGRRVLRLKGGDPFIFGRGGEEIGDLTRDGIAFQIVPGITAASGCAAYAGIPLTHRDYAQSCVFVTGHLKDDSVDLNWNLLCQPQQTVVVYMGLTGLDVLCREMIAHGTPRHLPAALIEQGTTPEQRVFPGTLETLPELVAGAAVHAPTLVIIGEVVRLHEQFRWYEGSSSSD